MCWFVDKEIDEGTNVHLCERKNCRMCKFLNVEIDE